MGTWGTQQREMSAEVRATWGCGRCAGHKIPSRRGGRLCLQRGRRVGTHSQLQGKGDAKMRWEERTTVKKKGIWVRTWRRP